jgi:hypothetical protein
VSGTQGWNSLVSTVTIGCLTGSNRDSWVKQIREYSAWYSQEILNDVKANRRAQVIMKGWAWKKGTMSFSAWKLRFFVLLSNREMLYYEQEMGCEPLGAIELKKKIGVKTARSVDKPQGFDDVLEIDTSGRTWYFSPQALNRSEHGHLLKEWLHAIEASDANFEKHHTAEDRRRGSFTVFSSTSFFTPPLGQDLDLSKAAPLVDLTSWQRISGNVPSTVLSPSPPKAEFLMTGTAMGEKNRRRSIVTSGQLRTGDTEMEENSETIQTMQLL